MDGKFLGKISKAVYELDDDLHPEAAGLVLKLEFSFDGRGSSWRIHDMSKILKLIKDAKVTSPARLEGRPVEVSTMRNAVVDFRILTEVL